MRKAETTDSELRQQLDTEIAQFKELSAQKKVMQESDEMWASKDTIHKFQQIKAQWIDSAEQIAYLYKKLHPYFPVGTCAHCGSVTTKIVGSNFKHYACVACGEESIE